MSKNSTKSNDNEMNSTHSEKENNHSRGQQGDASGELCGLQAVVFTLGIEQYGIDIFRVNEIIRIIDITAVPKTEEHIRGLVNLRGKTIPVVDLRSRLHLSPKEDTESSRIIVVESEHGNVGIVVDSVREVVTLESSQLERAPALITGDSNDFVWGVAKQGNQLITVLDLDKALSA